MFENDFSEEVDITTAEGYSMANGPKIARRKNCVKQDNMRQETPRAQLVVILQSVMGDLQNRMDGLEHKGQYPRMEKNLWKAFELLQGMPEGTWEE